MVVLRGDQDDEDDGMTNELQVAMIVNAFQAIGSDRRLIGATGRSAHRQDEN
jgi:hypothetical protein